MNLNITLVKDTNTLRTLRPWGDPVMLADSYSATVRTHPITGEPVGQFSFLPVFYRDASGSFSGTGSANSNFFNMTTANVNRIAALQRDDAFSVAQKMSYLTDGGDNTWGNVMRCTGDWRTATDTRFIGVVWAGQIVKVLGYETYRVTMNNKTEDALLARIETFTAGDWVKTHAEYPWLIQKYTCVDAGDRIDNPKGNIYLPVPSLEWDFAGNFVPAAAYVMARHLL